MCGVCVCLCMQLSARLRSARSSSTGPSRRRVEHRVSEGIWTDVSMMLRKVRGCHYGMTHFPGHVFSRRALAVIEVWSYEGCGPIED